MTRRKLGILAILLLIASFSALLIQKKLGVIFNRIALKEMNKLINTNAEVDNIDLSLLKGRVAFSGLKVQNPAGFSEKNFLEIKRGFIDVDLFSLLAKKNLVIQKIFLEEPNVAIEINRDSVSNTTLIFRKTTVPPLLPREPTQLLPLPSGEREGPIPVPAKAGKAGKAGMRGNKPRLVIDKINISDGIFKLTNYKVNRKGATVLFDRVNISIEDIRPPRHPDELPTAVRCSARLPAEDLAGYIELILKGALVSEKIDFDMNLRADSISLPYFMPFYAEGTAISAKKGWFEMHSTAKCRKNGLRAIQKVSIGDLGLVSNLAEPGGRIVFGLPVATVLNFFVRSRGRLDFDFEITGTVTDPKFHIKEALEKVLIKSMGEAILNRLSNLPDKLLEKVKETGKIEEAGKEALKDVFQKILELKKGQR